MLSFANPEFLYLLLLVPVLVAMYIFARVSRIKNLKRFGHIKVLSALMPDVTGVQTSSDLSHAII